MVQPIQGLYRDLIYFLQSLKNLKYFLFVFSQLYYFELIAHYIFPCDNLKLSILDLSEPLSNSEA